MHFTFCPHCGNKLIDREIGDEGRIPFCTACNVPLWDMFTTCVIVAVVNECGEIALLRQGYISESHFVCVSGIMKPGESAEETVAREVREEIGQDVLKTEYIASFPYEKKGMLMLGFKASVAKRDITLSGEVDSAKWVKLEDAPALMRDGSIAQQLVNAVLSLNEDMKDSHRYDNNDMTITI